MSDDLKPDDPQPGDLKPPAALSNEQKERLNEAIADGFDPKELEHALRYKWGIVVRNYVNTAQPFLLVVADLIAWTDRRGKTWELANFAYAERPGNDAISRLAHELGIARAEAERKYTLQKRPVKPSLEAMVASHSRFVDYDRFLSRFRALGDRVCKVTTPTKHGTKHGTGFLVGPDLLLTNCHVVDQVVSDSDAGRTVFEFDYRSGTATGEGGGSTYHRLAPSNWLVAKSPPSESDATGVGKPGEGEFDYALLRLAESVGESPSRSGGKRGWFSLEAPRPVVALNEFVVVPQHPEGRPLEIAWGSVLSFNDDGSRVKHNATTNRGSSGSPCLTADLEIFGLHHATDPSNDLGFNQAIPLELIARDLKDKKAL